MRFKQLQPVLLCLITLPHCRQEAVLLHCLQGQHNGDWSLPTLSRVHGCLWQTAAACRAQPKASGCFLTTRMVRNTGDAHIGTLGKPTWGDEGQLLPQLIWQMCQLLFQLIHKIFKLEFWSQNPDFLHFKLAWPGEKAYFCGAWKALYQTLPNTALYQVLSMT